MSARRHDWHRIRSEYIEGIVNADGRLVWPTQDELAARHDVRRQRIGERLQAEAWNEQRALYTRRLEEQRQHERASEVAKIAADLDVEAVRAARDGMAITRARIQELGMQSQRRIEALQAQDPVRLAQAPAVDALELERLSRSADMWYILGTRAVGLGPRTQVDVSVAGVEPVDDDERDRLTLEVIGLLQAHVPELLPAGFGEVVDVESRVHGVAGNGASGNGAHADADHEPLHPPHAHNGQS